MSQRNQETVRRYLEAINAGDWRAAFSRFVADDVEIDWSRSPAPYRGVYRGRDEAMRFAAALDVWANARVEPNEFIDAGDDVLVPHIVRLRGRDGIEVAVSATYVFTVRDGQCVAWRIYQEHGDALRAAGLCE
jgi:ketosteroid isomerase-like protein